MTAQCNGRPTSVPAHTDGVLAHYAVVRKVFQHQLSTLLFTHLASKPWEERGVVDLIFQRKRSRLRTRHATRQPYIYLLGYIRRPLRRLSNDYAPARRPVTVATLQATCKREQCIPSVAARPRLRPLYFTSVWTWWRPAAHYTLQRPPYRKLFMQTTPPLAKAIHRSSMIIDAPSPLAAHLRLSAPICTAPANHTMPLLHSPAPADRIQCKHLKSTADTPGSFDWHRGDFEHVIYDDKAKPANQLFASDLPVSFRLVNWQRFFAAVAN